jgi:hypothetical protein
LNTAVQHSNKAEELVMAGLVPAIHVFIELQSRKDVDARD